jgi:carbamoyl-phosphate synthase large subunit
MKAVGRGDGDRANLPREPPEGLAEPRDRLRRGWAEIGRPAREEVRQRLASSVVLGPHAPDPQRAQARRLGRGFPTSRESTRGSSTDPDIVDLERAIAARSLEDVDREFLRTRSGTGSAMPQIAFLLVRSAEEDVARPQKGPRRPCRRYRSWTPVPGSFPAQTPYFYSTYETSESESSPDRSKKVVILGSGPNRIGQGIEFDYSASTACWAHGSRLRGHHDQLQPGDGVDRLRHRGQALLRAGVLGAGARRHRARERPTA